MAGAWLDGCEFEDAVSRNGVLTATLKHNDGDFTAVIVERRDRGIERHILPALRRLGGGRYAALEDALQRGAVPAAIARDLHRLLRQAEDKAEGARRSARTDLMRGKLF